MKTLLQFWILPLFLGLFFQSCFDGKKFEFNKLSKSLDGTGSLATKVAYSRIKVSDLLKSKAESYLVYDAKNDSLLSFSYNKDSLYSVSVDQIFKTPQILNVQNRFTSEQIKFGSISKTTHISLQDISIHMPNPSLAKTAIDLARNAGDAGSSHTLTSFPDVSAGDYPTSTIADFEQITFSGGDLNIEVANNFKFPITITLEICSSNDLGNPLETFADILIVPGGVFSSLRPLKSKKYTNILVGRIKKFRSTGSDGLALIKSADELSYKIDFVNPIIESGRAKVPGQTMKSFLNFKEVNSNYELKKVYLTKGSLDITISSKFQSPVSLSINLPFATNKNGSPIPTTVMNINPNQTKLTRISLTDLIMDLSLNDQNISNSIQVTYTATCNNGQMADFSSLDYLDYNVDAKDVDFEYVVGYFGQREILINSEKVDLGIDAFSKIKGDLKFSNPSIDLKITNFSMAVPLELSPIMTAFTKDRQKSQDLSFTNSPVVLTTPISFYSFASTDLKINNTNSKIVDFIGLPVSEIVFAGKMLANSSINKSYTNFVTRKGYIKVGASVNFPFEFSSNGITFSDTIKNSIVGKVKLVKEGQLLFDYKNSLPIEAAVSLILLDDKDHSIDVIPLKGTDGSLVMLNSANYDVITNNTFPVSDSFSVKLTELNLVNLNKASKIIILGTASTKGKSVNFKGRYALEINLRTSATVDYSKI